MKIGQRAIPPGVPKTVLFDADGVILLGNRILKRSDAQQNGFLGKRVSEQASTELVRFAR
jgi:hypothetical protein